MRKGKNMQNFLCVCFRIIAKLKFKISDHKIRSNEISATISGQIGVKMFLGSQIGLKEPILGKNTLIL